jgi:hypothetical protein
VKGLKGKAVYVVEDNLLRPIPSGDVFEAMGWKWKNIVAVSDKLLDSYQKGDPITLDAPRPTLILTEATTPTSTTSGAL